MDLTDTVSVENGTVQGNVISPILFNTMVNDMFDEVGDSFGRSLFADDGVIWKRGHNVGYLKQMQSALDKLQEWAEKWGFRLSVTKTKYFW